MKSKFGDRSELIEQVRFYSSEIQELKAEIAKDSLAKAQLEEEFGLLSEKYEETLDELSARKEDLSELENAADKLQIELDQSKTALEELEARADKERAGLHDRILELEATVSSQLETIDNLTYENEDQTSKCRELEAQIEDLECTRQSLIKEAELKKSEVVQIQGVLKELEQIVKQKETHISEKDQELKDARLVQKIADKRQDDLESQVNTLNKKIVTLMQDETMAKNLIEEKIRIIKRFQLREQKMIEESESIRKQLQAQYDAVRNVEGQAEAESAYKELELALHDQIENLKSQLADSHLKTAELEARLS